MPMKYTPTWATSKDAVPPGHTQITVYDEATGNRVATVFEAEAVSTIALAPTMRRYLGELLGCCELNMDDMEPETRKLVAEVGCFLADEFGE